MSKVADSILQLVQPIAQSMDLEVVEVAFEKKYNGMNLTIFIDNEIGIDVDICEKFHRAIIEPIDELDPIAGQYILNVSSLGIDRPLKTNRDYKKNLNKKIFVKLYQADDNNNKQYEGILIEYNDDTFVIDIGNETVMFGRHKVAHVEPVIEF